jgi:hypothetical protein
MKYVLILLVVMFLLFVAGLRYTAMETKARQERNKQIEQIVRHKQTAPLVGVEKMWRDKARCATLEGDTYWADHYNLRADEARSMRLGM